MTRCLLRCAAVLVLALVTAGVQAQPTPLARAIDQALDNAAVADAWWGAVIVNLQNGTVLYHRNAARNFVPASNTKLYTTAAALDLLGPDFRYRTEVFADGPVVDGVLQGNLIVRGSGDPVIGGRFNDGDRTEVFRAWADSLRTLGITRIAGDVIGDDDAFDDVPLGYGWSWDDEPYWYAAEISALSFNDNNIDFALVAQAPGQPAAVTWEPHQTSYVEVINRTLTTPAGGAIDEGYARARSTNTLTLSSRVPAGRTDFESLTVTNPTLFFVHVLQEVLLQEGLAMGGRAVDVDDLSLKPDYAGGGYRRVAVHTSPPLAEIVRVINKRSQNLYAEQLLKTLAAQHPSDGPDLAPGSAERGLDVARQSFAVAGIDTSRIGLVDGSGLSRLNLVTPTMTAALLRYLWDHPDDAVRTAFYESLPIGGMDGTLERRYAGGPARGQVRAKTGTLTNVSALSGYISSAKGTPLAFVLMCNHHTTKGQVVRGVQDQIVQLLARAPW